MELRHIRYFLAVADEGNFTRAADKLGIAQPPLSQQIRALEDELGVQLFHRVPHGAELTAAGRAFLTEARLTISAAERAKNAAQRAQRGESGRLLLGFTTSAAYNPIISSTVDAFHHRWPDVSLALEEANTSPLYQRVLSGDLDAAFIRPVARAPEGIRLEPLENEKTVVALPANHALAQRERLRLADLALEPFIIFPRAASPAFFDEIFAACRASGFEPLIHQEAERTASTVNLVAAHLGVTIVPTSMKQIQLPGVAYRDIEGPAPVARLALATVKSNRSPIIRNFLALLMETSTERAPTPTE